MAISDNDLKMVRYILMYDDETVLDAVAAYRDAGAIDWWTLVVDVGGSYAVTTFADITNGIQEGKDAFLGSKLGSLVGSILQPVELVVERASGDRKAVQLQAENTLSRMAVVVDQGEFKGMITAAGSRAVLFGSDLVKLAGQYADLPTTGLISRRRQEAIAARKKKE